MALLFETLVQGLLIGSGYALIAIGMAVVYNVSGILNFAHGDFITLGMYACLALLLGFGVGPYIGLLLVTPAFAVLGILFYLGLIRPLQDTNMLMVVQITLGLTFIIQNLILYAFGSIEQVVQTPISAVLLHLTDRFALRLTGVIAGGVSLGLILGLYVLIQRSDFGRAIRAIHQNPRGAAVCGIDVARVRAATFALAFAVMGVASCILAPTQPFVPGGGLMISVTAILVLILGGLGSFHGTLLGGLVVGLSQTVGTVYLGGTLGLALPYIIFVLVLLFRPGGLVGGRSLA